MFLLKLKLFCQDLEIADIEKKMFLKKIPVILLIKKLPFDVYGVVRIDFERK